MRSFSLNTRRRWYEFNDLLSRGRNPIVRLKDYLIERVRFPPGGRGVKKFAFPSLVRRSFTVTATSPLTLPPPKGESKRVSSLSTLLALLVINAQNLRAKDLAFWITPNAKF